MEIVFGNGRRGRPVWENTFLFTFETRKYCCAAKRSNFVLSKKTAVVFKQNYSNMSTKNMHNISSTQGECKCVIYEPKMVIYVFISRCLGWRLSLILKNVANFRVCLCFNHKHDRGFYAHFRFVLVYTVQ